MVYIDHPPESAERAVPGSDLGIRLARLPDAHPAKWRGPDGGTDQRGRFTDAEHAEHVADVRAVIDDARATGQTTEMRHTTDKGHEVWTRERELQHTEIVQALYATAKDVPCEGRAIVAGGLAGCGKTTVLREHAGIEPGRFMMINPDDVKQELAKRDMVPQIAGLSPMEAAELAHEESSHIAKRLAQIATAERRNVIWDITMSSGPSTEQRVDALRAAGYTDIHGIFVDVPIEVSLQRADARHRQGHDDWRAGIGLGGRFVRSELTEAQADPEWGSVNRRNFELVKPELDSFDVFDNSRDGEAPMLVEASRPRPEMREGDALWLATR